MNNLDNDENILISLVNNLSIDTSEIERQVAYKVILKDLESLSESFICNIEPQLNCEYNEYYDHPNFNIRTVLNILNEEYSAIINQFIEINKRNNSDLMFESNNIYTYIDYYIENLQKFI